jgi:hypothetical protein
MKTVKSHVKRVVSPTLSGTRDVLIIRICLAEGR